MSNSASRARFGTYCHIERRPGEGPCKAIHQLPANSEITKLDLSTPGHQDVTRLNIPMNDLAFVQIIQAAQHGFGDLAQNLFARPASSPCDLPDKGVQRPSLAKFHQNPDTRVRVSQERAVVFDDVGRLAFVQELQLTEELFVNGRVGRGGDDLECNGEISDQDKAQKNQRGSPSWQESCPSSYP